MTLGIVGGGCDQANVPAERTSEPPGQPADAAQAPTRDCPEPAIPPGVYVADIRERDVVRAFNELRTTSPELLLDPQLLNDDYLAELIDFVPGRWTWYQGVADPNCRFTLWFTQERGGEITFLDSHPHRVAADGRTIVSYGAGEPPGRNRVTLDGDDFTLQLVADHTTRTVVHIAVPWRRVGDP